MSDLRDRIDRLSPEQRAALAQLLSDTHSNINAYVNNARPRDAQEQELIRIWSSVLDIEEIGIHDNYFELGGDSISSIQILARARAVDIQLTAEDLFAYPTIAELSSYMASRRRHREEDRLPSLNDDKCSDGKVHLNGLLTYPLTGSQQAILAQIGNDGASYIAQFTCRIEGEFDSAIFSLAWQKVVLRHDVLRTTFHWDGIEQPVQAVHLDPQTEITLIDWKSLNEAVCRQRLQAFLVEDRVKKFNLQSGPLARITIIDFGSNSYQCIWTHHHLILDGWSQLIVLREVFASYDAYKKGYDLELPPAPLFGDFVRALHNHSTHDAEQFWSNYLRDGVWIDPWVKFVPQVAHDSDSILESCEGSITENEITSLHEFAKLDGITVSSIVHSIWALTLMLHAGTKDIVFGSTFSGRSLDYQYVEQLVGVCINTLPVRVKIKSECSVRDWMKRNHEEQAQLLKYVATPLSKIKSLCGLPAVQALFGSILVLQSLPVKTDEFTLLADARLVDIQFQIRESYPLVMVLAPGVGMTAHLKYLSNCISKEDASQLLINFVRLLGKVPSSTNESLSEFIDAEMDARDAALKIRRAQIKAKVKTRLSFARRQSRRIEDGVS